MNRPARLGLSLLALVALGTSGCAYFNTLYNARTKYSEAQDLKDQADPDRDRISGQEERLYDEAIEKASKVVKYYPDSKWVDDALLLIGKSSFEKEDFTQARRKFNEILTLFPESNLTAETLVLMGRTQIEIQDYAGARETLARAEQMNKKQYRGAVAYFQGVVHEELGQEDEALVAYTNVLEKHRNTRWVTHAGMRAGDISSKRGDLAAAAEYYKRVFLRAPLPEERYRGGMRWGEVLRELGDYQASARAFRAVADRTIDTNEAGLARLEAGKALAALGNEHNALGIYDKIIKDLPRKEAAAEAQYAKAQYFDERGDLQRAHDEYELVSEQGTGYEAWRNANDRRLQIQKVFELRDLIADESAKQKEKRRFLLAEHYLEKIGDDEAALAEYSSLATDAEGSDWGARALYAQAWVYENRLDQPDTAQVLLSRLATKYTGTEVGNAARHRLGLPVWTVEVLEPPPVQFIRPEGEAEPEDISVSRVAPKDVPLPEGVSKVEVWARLSLKPNGEVESVKIVKSGGAAFDQAVEEAALASVFLGPDAGGPAITVQKYSFPPEAETSARSDPTPRVTGTAASPPPGEQFPTEEILTPQDAVSSPGDAPRPPLLRTWSGNRRSSPDRSSRRLGGGSASAGRCRSGRVSARLEIGTVVRSEDAAPGVGLLTFRSPGIAAAYRPGTFVHLATGDDTTILRRPFSIARVRGDEVILL